MIREKNRKWAITKDVIASAIVGTWIIVLASLVIGCIWVSITPGGAIVLAIAVASIWAVGRTSRSSTHEGTLFKDEYEIYFNDERIK